MIATPSGTGRRVDPLDLSFRNHEAAFKSKTTLEVLRALIVFKFCSIRVLVDNSDRVKHANKLRIIFF